MMTDVAFTEFTAPDCTAQIKQAIRSTEARIHALALDIRVNEAVVAAQGGQQLNPDAVKGLMDLAVQRNNAIIARATLLEALAEIAPPPPTPS